MKPKSSVKKTKNKADATSIDVANYLCNFDSVCDLAFPNIKELLEHVKSHFGPNNLPNFEEIVVEAEPTKIGIYKCDQCDAHYKRSEELLLHRRVHLGLPLYSCHRCPRKFALSNNLFNHVKNVHSEIIDPERLSEIFDQTDAKKGNDLQRYERVLINGKTFIRKYFCPVCPLVFVKMKTLEIHCRRNHLASEYTCEELANIEKTVLTSSYRECFKCSCGLKFQRPSLLDQHVQQVHTSFDRLKCKYCSFVFLQQHSLVSHIKKHEGENVRRCKICQIPFVEEQDLKKHFRIHQAGKPHQCDVCNKQFAQSCDLTKHSRIHTGEKPFECEICRKKFTHLTSVKKHELVHSGAKPFVCNVCGKAFNFNSNLVVHKRIHTGERPYQCKVDGCGKSFYASGHYNDHMKIHTGVKNYKCLVCCKEFLHQSSFRKHEKMHNGGNKVQCNFCEKSFSQQGHYKEHLRTHTGEKPYFCQICDKTFRRVDARNKHMKMHEKTALLQPSDVLQDQPVTTSYPLTVHVIDSSTLVEDSTTYQLIGDHIFSTPHDGQLVYSLNHQQ